MTFAEAVKSRTGRTVGELKSTVLCEMCSITEKRTGRPMVIETRFPTIGRGNVMRDRIISHEAVEQYLEESLRK